MIKKMFFLIFLGSILLNMSNCEKKVEQTIAPPPTVEEKVSPPLEKKAPPPQEPAPKIFEDGIEEENIPAE